MAFIENYNFYTGRSERQQRELIKLLEQHNLKLETLMANITELSAKVTELEAALDAEQAQIAAAIAALEQAVEDLNVLVAEGGSPAERQALADRIEAIKTDLEGTIADVPPVDEPPTE